MVGPTAFKLGSRITWVKIPTPDFDPTLDLRSVLAPIISVLALILRSSVENRV